MQYFVTLPIQTKYFENFRGRVRAIINLRPAPIPIQRTRPYSFLQVALPLAMH
jgi:hypothetical protein